MGIDDRDGGRASGYGSSKDSRSCEDSREGSPRCSASNELKRAMDMETYEAPIRQWERDLAVSDADVYEEETPDESIDEVHNPDGTFEEFARQSLVRCTDGPHG